jgi:hypothetical protein
VRPEHPGIYQIFYNGHSVFSGKKTAADDIKERENSIIRHRPFDVIIIGIFERKTFLGQKREIFAAGF